MPPLLQPGPGVPHFLSAAAPFNLSGPQFLSLQGGRSPPEGLLLGPQREDLMREGARGGGAGQGGRQQPLGRGPRDAQVLPPTVWPLRSCFLLL